MSQHFNRKIILSGIVVTALLTISSSQVIAQGSTTRALEEQIRTMEQQLQTIRGELDRVKSNAVQDSQKVEALEQSTVTHSAATTGGKHMVFFRGGYARSNNLRNGVSIQSNVAPVGAQEQADRNAWYISAGFDFNLTDNVWDLMPGTSVFAELMFEYKQFGKVAGGALANSPTQLAGGTLNPNGVTVDMFTLTASPKIKFMEGSRFRPWIIPAGLAIHVVSPPTESITVLQPGVMFAAGADYNIWKSVFLGIDARYHLTSGRLDGVKVDGFTAGGYLGIGF
ncbi:MAG TPA: porin family protein [Nitrosomonas mobilis]|nr:porin family protein [Nitrosomonas mobilis]